MIICILFIIRILITDIIEGILYLINMISILQVNSMVRFPLSL